MAPSLCTCGLVMATVGLCEWGSVGTAKQKIVLIKMHMLRKNLERAGFHWETIYSVLLSRECVNWFWCERGLDCPPEKQYSSIVSEGPET